MDEGGKTDGYGPYLEAIRRRVCAVCLDQRDDGTCRLSKERTCAIEAQLPRLVETILAIHSDWMDEYVAAVRREVCAVCGQEIHQASCAFRDKGECALWTYLPLVVDAIEEAPRSVPKKEVGGRS